MCSMGKGVLDSEVRSLGCKAGAGFIAAPKRGSVQSQTRRIWGSDTWLNGCKFRDDAGMFFRNGATVRAL